MSVIRAIVVDDSAFNRVTLARMLESTGQVEVVATAVNGEDAIKKTLRQAPDLITLDLEMPVMDGFAFLRWLMANRPTPVIAVSSRSSDRSVFKALELGAVDFIAKPGGRVSPRLEEIEADLVAKALQATNVALENVAKRIRAPEPKEVVAHLSADPKKLDLVVIGSSTGGPPALQTIFQTTPVIPVPVVVAQHMPATFTRLFAERVNRLSRFEVKEAENGEVLRPGTVYIAPGGRQCRVLRDQEALRVRIADRTDQDLHAPSVNQLFETAAEACGERVLAIVLTGMGDDGAAGIRAIRRGGGRTMAESSETAIIFGMPAEAIKTGGIEQILGLGDIPQAIEAMFAAE